MRRSLSNTVTALRHRDNSIPRTHALYRPRELLLEICMDGRSWTQKRHQTLSIISQSHYCLLHSTHSPIPHNKEVRVIE